MKRTLTLFLLLAMAFSSPAQKTLNLVPSESKLAWKASYSLNLADGHHGVIHGISGTLTTGADDKILKGYFNLDLNTIKVLDMKTEEEREDLARHLKSDDFFSVDKYPTGLFQIIAVNYSEDGKATIDGFLSLKGVANRINFPVTIESDGKSMRTRGSVMIDRTKWNVNYQSSSIFADLKDGAISDQVMIELDVRFR